MGRLLVFTAGLLSGIVAAHLLARTPAGRRALAVVNGAVDEFARAVADSYRARLAETP